MSLPREIIQDYIFPYLSPKDQEAFRSVNREARSISPRALAFNMSSVQDHEISEVSAFLAARTDIQTLKITYLKPSILIPVLTSLQDERFRFFSLINLDLGSNTQDVIPVLRKIMPLVPNLMSLSVEFSGLEEEDADVISEMIPHLTTLHIGGNIIGDEGADFISSGMLKLRTLGIFGCGIGDRGAIAISGMPLRTLNIALNLIGDEGATAISEMPHLRTLDIFQNQIGPAGEAALRTNPHLKSS